MLRKKEEYFMSNEERLAVVETTMNNINSALHDLRQDMKDFRHEMRDDMRAMRTEIGDFRNHVDNRFDKLYQRVWSNLFWTIGAIVGLAGLVAHALHWI